VKYHRESTMQFKLLTTLLTSIALTGCTVEPTTAFTTGTSSVSANWQIQEGSSITPFPTGVSLVGALQAQGSQVTGTFYTTPICSTPRILSYTGSIDSMGNLALAAPVQVQLLLPAVPTAIATGTIDPPASLPGDTVSCALASGPVPAVGVEIAPLTGTFTGTVTATGSNPSVPIPSGSVSLTLTQSSTPNVDGQFNLIGSLNFTGDGCSSTTSVAGIISGIGINLRSSAIPAIGQPPFSLTAYTNPAALQITASGNGMVFTPSPCSTNFSSSTTFTGSLTRQ
jgi:hypothetical protein